MHSFAIISRPAGRAESTPVEDRIRSGLRRIAPQSEVVERTLPGGFILLYAYAGKVRPAANLSGDAAFFLASRNYDENLHREIELTEFLGRIAEKGIGAASTMAPPFAVAWPSGEGQPFNVATDRYGLFHVFGYQGDGVAAISSSALLLGRGFQLRPSKKGISHLALLGHLHGTSTCVEEVTRLGHGSAFSVKDGVLTESRYSTAPKVDGGRFSTVGEAAEEGAEILRGIGENLVKCYPDCAIDLSGGLDTRLALAALPKESREGRRAFTIGSPQSDDVRIAKKLAGASGMDHDFVDLGGIEDLDTAELTRLVYQGSVRNDCTFSSLDCGLFEWLRGSVGGGPRITGQNGEIARGFYSANQNLNAPVTAARLKRLVTWRIVSQASQDKSLFLPDVYDSGIADLTTDLEGLFEGFEPVWGDAIDQYYLYGRMQFWGGRGLTGGAAERMIVAPFFDEKFVDWAFRLTPDMRSGSKAFNAVIKNLDTDLAHERLDSGLSPAQMLASGNSIGLAGASAAIKLKKIATKVRERYSSFRRPSRGTEFIGNALQARGVGNLIDTERLMALNLFDDKRLERLAGLNSGVRPAELGFLLSVDWMCAFLAGDDE